MKILYLAIISIIMTTSLFTIHQVYAPCLVGVTNCGPPPEITIAASPDSQFYEKNDTITIQGQVYIQNYTKAVTIQVISPNNTKLESLEASVNNGIFSSKVTANFNTTGLYQLVYCTSSGCDRSYIKYVSEPYHLLLNGKDFAIKYKSFADLAAIEADINSQALRVHIENATAQGLRFVIELPRDLIDSKRYDGKDANFRVLIGMHQPDKYMQPANYTEISSSNQSRTLAIDIPYEPVQNSNGIWDFKIMHADVSSGPGVSSEPPLKLFKLGMSVDQIHCKQELVSVIKSADGSPACVKYTTANTLIERGWAKKVVQNITSSEVTVIIPTNSSNIYNGFTFSPPVVNVVIGKNNTVKWINMDSVTNDITSDTGSFNQTLIESGYAWTHTFDKTGTYSYHSVIHPWLTGEVIVTSDPLINLKNDTGIIVLGNQTYYFETPTYIHDSIFNSSQISFHGVVFTLFPSGFRGGLPVSCGTQYYWIDAKFSDDTSESLHIFAGPDCPVPPLPISFSKHENPQAGLTYYDGKMKLLVSTDSQNITKNTTGAKFQVQKLRGSQTVNCDSSYTPCRFSETDIFSGNVGKITIGLPVQVKISDPYDMSDHNITIPSANISPDGSFNFTYTLYGKFGQDIYTLDLTYGDQKYRLDYVPVPPIVR